MRFVVGSEPRHPVQPEMLPRLLDALLAWLEQHRDKFVEVWGYAGTQGGGGLVEVESLEELNQMMTEFPFAPFSEMKVTPVIGVRESVEAQKAHLQKVLAMMSQN